MSFSTRNILSFILFSIVILTIVYCGDPSPKEALKESLPTATGYLNHHDSAKYVGMSQCKLCHQDIYNSYIQTGMGKSFEHASKTKSAAKFSAHTVIYDKYQDFYYHPFWEGDSLKIMEFRLKGKDTIHKRIERVDYIIGSGHHTNSHITNSNGYLHQMPMTFYTQKQKWDFPPGFEDGFNTRFSRKIGLECMSCHNSLPDFAEGSENKFNALPEGVSCERCHGPGSIHVQQRSTGSKIDTSKYIDYSIVNPGKLPIDLQFDVCQRCHLQGNTVLKEGKSFLDFKPGKKLSDYMTTFLPRYKNADDEFIMASHADRLKQSKCFINSYKEETDKTSLRPYKNSLTCVTCHNPHVSVKATGKEIFNTACKNCHSTSTKNGLCSEKEVVRAKVQDNCVSCHMPNSGSIDIPHVTVHDHYIRKPMKKEEIQKVKEFIGLYAINEKNPSNYTKAKAYIQQYDKFEYKTQYLDSAAFYLSDKTKEDVEQNFELLVHLNFIKQDYKKIIGYLNQVGNIDRLKKPLNKKSWDNSNAWTAYRIGEAYASLGDLSSAFSFYSRAIDLSPKNPEFRNKLAGVMMAMERYDAAISVLNYVVIENPNYTPALNNLGYANLLKGNVLKAEELYNRARKLDPDYESLLMNIAGLKIYQKKYKEAEEQLNTILKKNPKNEQAKRVLSQLKALK
ncbi:MAG: tetratricopeptide repeat protein [Bacteroidetes bacterium]|nr:tetratricopeptide repeat protein [Bacteroidota bacterium]